MVLLPLLPLIAGLILVLAGSSWFAGAATVGWILLVAGAIMLVALLVCTAIIGRMAAKRFKEFDKQFTGLSGRWPS